MCRVLNKRHAGVPAGAVYIGRGSKWGNLRLRGWRMSSLRNCHRCRAHMTTCDSREGARQSKAERMSPGL